LANEILAATEKPPALLEQAALQWRGCYHVVANYRDSHPDWSIVRHEDLSRNAVAGFRSLLTDLGMRYSPRIHQEVIASSSAANPKDASGSEELLQRDSVANIGNWKTRLRKRDIKRIRRLTEDVACHFYGESDW
jgi:hypothetical protein